MEELFRVPPAQAQQNFSPGVDVLAMMFEEAGF